MTADSASSEGEVCVANIGPRERRKRLRIGQVAGAVTLLLFCVLVFRHAPWPAAFAVLLPASVAALGYFQAKEKT